VRNTLRHLYRALGLAFEPKCPSTAAVVAPILGEYSVNVIDVGARGGAGDAWYRLSPLARLIGFEPDAEECARLNRQVARPGAERYVAAALGRHSGPAEFHRTRAAMCSSLYRPDPEVSDRYPVLEAMRQVSTDPLQLTTLEEWAHANDVDNIRFLKLDTQGSELDILEGAGSLLDDCLGIEVEVEFSPLYVGQPLFADIDAYLRQKDFVLWRLGDLTHYSANPARQRLRRREHAYYDNLHVSAQAGNGRLMWGNALYFRDYRDLEDPRALLILAALLDAAGDDDSACESLRRSLALPGDIAPADCERIRAHLSALRHNPLVRVDQ
jgi:FkbM family methyltransferase